MFLWMSSRERKQLSRGGRWYIETEDLPSLHPARKEGRKSAARSVWTEATCA